MKTTTQESTTTMKPRARRVVKRKYVNMQDVRCKIMVSLNTEKKGSHPLDILKVVCEAYQITMEELTKRYAMQRISRDVTDASQIAAVMLFIRTPMDIDSIAALLNRDRTSVNHYITNFVDVRFSKQKTSYKQMSELIENTLNQMPATR